MRQLAQEIGVTERIIGHAENGAKPRPENARKIAEYFGYRATELWPTEDRAA